MAFNLGDVVLNLRADTAGLDRALGTIRNFSSEINRLSSLTDDSSQRTAQAYARQERALMGVYEKVIKLRSELQRSGAPAQAYADLTKVMKNLSGAMTQVELGTIEMGRAQIYANNQLNTAQRVAKQYSDQLKAQEKAAHSAAAAAQQLANAQAKANAEITSRASRSETRATRLGATSGMAGIAAARAQFTAQVGAAGNTTQVQTALIGFRNAIGQVEDGFRRAGHVGENYIKTMRNFERATILAVGPLSGLGARMAVLAELLETNTAKAAMAVGGFTLLSAGLYHLGAAAVNAQTAITQMEAKLGVASGGAYTMATQFEYVRQIAMKYGKDIKGLGNSYADLAIAASTSGVSLTTTRKLFEGMTKAGTALMWNNEKTGLAFKAMTDIISKGKIHLEEMKQQLGDHIPGALAEAAKAMNMKMPELMQAIKDGTLDMEEFIGRFGDSLGKTYGEAAEKMSTAVPAALQRLSTVWTLFLSDLDRTVGLSEKVGTALDLIARAVESLRKNIDTLLIGVAALMGALGGLAAASVVNAFITMASGVGSLIGLFAKLITGIRATTAAIWAMGIAMVGSGVGGFVKLALMLVGAVGGGVAAHYALRDSVDATTQSYGNLTNEVDNYIRKGAGRLASTNRHVLETQLEALRSFRNELQKEVAVSPAGGKASPMLPGRKTSGNDEGLQKLLLTQQRIEGVNQRIKILEGDLKALPAAGAGAVDSAVGGKAAATALENVLTKLYEYKNTLQALAAAKGGDFMTSDRLQKLDEAKKALEDLSKGGLAKVNAELTRLGFTSGTTTERLAALFAAIAAGKKDIQEIEKATEKYHEVVGYILTMEEDIAAALNTGNPALAKRQLEVKRYINTIQEEMRKAAVPEDQIRAALASASAQQMQIKALQDVSTAQNYVIATTRRLAEMQNSSEVAIMSANEEYQKQADLAELLSAASSEEGDIFDRLARKVLELAAAYRDLTIPLQHVQKFIADSGRELEYHMLAYEDALTKIAELQRTGVTGSFGGDIMESDAAAKLIPHLEAYRDKLLSAAEAQKNLGDAGVDAYMNTLKELSKVNKQIEEFHSKTQKLWDELGETFKESFINSFTEVIEGTKSVSDAFRDMAVSILRHIQDKLLANLSDMIWAAVSKAIQGAVGGTGSNLLGTFAKSFLSSAAGGIGGTSYTAFSGTAAEGMANFSSMDFNAISAFSGSFADGGDFTVGGHGGTDSKLVTIRATPGETVSVRRPDQNQRERSRVQMTMNVNLSTPDGNISRQSLQQMQTSVGQATARALRRNS